LEITLSLGRRRNTDAAGVLGDQRFQCQVWWLDPTARLGKKSAASSGRWRRALGSARSPMSRAAQWVARLEPPIFKPHDQVYASDPFSKGFASDFRKTVEIHTVIRGGHDDGQNPSQQSQGRSCLSDSSISVTSSSQGRFPNRVIFKRVVSKTKGVTLHGRHSSQLVQLIS